MEREIIDVDDFIPDVECMDADPDIQFIGQSQQSQQSQQFPRQTPSTERFESTSSSSLKHNVCKYDIPIKCD
jgi:hypothetical protein